jgi:hypothetical protein
VRALAYSRYVVRRFRFALAPRWFALHLLVLAACVVMVFLGRWQWRVAHVHNGDVRNYAYALQWWIFSGFAVLLWLRVVRDAAQPTTATSHDPIAETSADESPTPAIAYRRYVMPQGGSSDEDAFDEEHARYNAYLAALADGTELRDPGKRR